MFTFTRTYLKQRVNAGIKGKIDMLIDEEQTINDAAREVVAECNLKTTRRRLPLQTHLFSDVYRNACPDDAEGYSIIDFEEVDNSRGDQEFFLVPVEQFDRTKTSENGIFAVDYFNGVKTLLVSVDVDQNKSQLISEFDSLTEDGGTWQAYGAGTNVRLITQGQVEGDGAIAFDLDATSSTEAGIINTALDIFDFSAFLEEGYALVWTGISNADSITSFKLRLGNDDLNYYEYTVTANHDNTPFRVGKNLLSFKLSASTKVGAPSATNATYAVLFMVKGTDKISQTSFTFDYFTLRNGNPYEIKYQSMYPWVSSTGVWKQDSDDDLDLLAAGPSEFELIRLKCIQRAAEEVEEDAVAELKSRQYQDAKRQYELDNPTEVKIMTTEYHSYGDFVDYGGSEI